MVGSSLFFYYKKKKAKKETGIGCPFFGFLPKGCSFGA